MIVMKIFNTGAVAKAKRCWPEEGREETVPSGGCHIIEAGAHIKV